MKILIIGGSHFLGRHISEAVIAQGHRLTLFNRGKTHPFLFAASEEIHGDRYQDLSLLRGHSWDVVIDTCGYHPASVGRSAHFLKGSVDRYVLISSISVYQDFSIPHIDEAAEIRGWPDNRLPSDDSPDTYGARKVLCELAAAEVFGDRLLVVRPGVLTGPYDSFGRVPYWLQRLARGGDILAPGNPQQPLQVLDARDLAEWILKMVEARQSGIFNAVGPRKPLTIGEFLTSCQNVVGGEGRFVWANESFLLSKDVAPWTEIPLWVPEFIHGLQEIKGDRAFAQGLFCRPLATTLSDTFDWMVEAKPSWPNQAWLTNQREAQLLVASSSR